MTSYDNSLIHFGIKGMKWGVRRYENADGSLTDAGKKRYAKEQLKNNAKKKENRMGEDAVRDANRWTRDDIDNARKTADSIGDLARKGQEIEKTSRPSRQRMDLSKMTDKEMRERINRELLERQYNDLFNKEKISKGRERVKESLQLVGSVAGIASTALGIALTIKQMKG